MLCLIFRVFVYPWREPGSETSTILIGPYEYMDLLIDEVNGVKHII
jgi:hypothetical protein